MHILLNFLIMYMKVAGCALCLSSFVFSDPNLNISTAARWRYAASFTLLWPIGLSLLVNRMRLEYYANPAIMLSLAKDGHGYWIHLAKGEILAYGSAVYVHPREAVQATPGDEYPKWDEGGRVIGRVDESIEIDLHKVPLNAPIVYAIATTSGNGYLLLAADGGVFCYGDAVFCGSPALAPGMYGISWRKRTTPQPQWTRTHQVYIPIELSARLQAEAASQRTRF